MEYGSKKAKTVTFLECARLLLVFFDGFQQFIYGRRRILCFFKSFCPFNSDILVVHQKLLLRIRENGFMVIFPINMAFTQCCIAIFCRYVGSLFLAMQKHGLLQSHTALHDFNFSTTGATSKSYMRKVEICSFRESFSSFCCLLIRFCDILLPSVFGTIFIGDLYCRLTKSM